MKISLPFLLQAVLLACCRQLYAQTILTGTVRDPAGKPLEGILLEAETKAQPPATAFVISGADGSFKLTLAATPASDSLRLSARALGYAEQLVRLANRSQPACALCRPTQKSRAQGAPSHRKSPVTQLPTLATQAATTVP